MTREDGTPPQDMPAERSVLGSMMLSAEAVVAVTDLLRGPDYYHPHHEAIHDAIVSLHSRGEPVDMVSAAGELTRRGHLERFGGAPYLHTLVSEVHIAANAGHHAQQVLDAALARRLVEAGARVSQLGYTGGDMTLAAQDARQVVEAAADQARTADGGVTAADGLDAAVDWLETPPVGADTPWVDVNDRTNGLLAGQMVTVAARPGHGKSLACKDVGVFTARQGKPVHIATLEMTRNEYLARIIAGLARVDLGRMLRRQMSPTDWERVAGVQQKVRELPMYLDDRERQSMAQIRAAARQTQRRFGGGQLGLIGIDYAQLVQPADTRVPREQQVAQISRDTKLMAKEFGCPVLLLAQLNRRGSDRSDPTPLVTDLRESGSLEQDSDQVWLLHRPDQHGDEGRLGEVDLIVGKNRNGPAPITVPLAFQGHYASIVSMV